METIIWIIVLTGIITLLTRTIIHSPLYVSVLIYLGIPALLILYWNLVDFKAPYFAYLKLFSLSIGVLLMAAVRHKPWSNSEWLKYAVFAVLAINVLEAVLDEASWGSLINPIVGIVVILTQAFPSKIFVDPDDPKRNFQYDLGIPWIAAYVGWNFAFNYAIYIDDINASPYAAFAVAHLAGPIFLMRKAGTHFIQARGYSLFLFFVVFMTVPFEPFFYYSPNWHHPIVLLLVQLTAAGLAMWALVDSIKKANRIPKAQNLIQLMISRFPNVKSKAQKPVLVKYD